MNSQSPFSPKPKPNINLLIEENTSLKNKLKLYQEKEKLYKSSIIKMKKVQSEYQITFIKTLNDYKAHEDKIKKTFIKYQKLLERHYKSSENRFINDNNALYLELRQKNNIIKNLVKKINYLIDKLDKTKNAFQFKNQKLEDEVLSKDRKINQLNDSMFQLAKETNDEIKLLRDEFNIYKKENKKIRKTEGNNDNNLYNNNALYLSNRESYDKLYKNKSISLDKKIYTNEDINYLINRLYLLENQNKILIQKLKRKEEELSICNNLKNELLYNNQMNQYVSSIDQENDSINNLKFQNLEKILKNYGKKINNIKTQFDESLIRHQNEIQELKKSYENNNSQFDINNINSDNEIEDNNISNQYSGNIHNYDNYLKNDYINNYDINEFEITNNINNINNINTIQNKKNDEIPNFNSDDEIKDEYIKSQLPKINTLD